MNCPKCQNPLAPGARFCSHCGSSLEAKGGPGFAWGVVAGVGALTVAIAGLAMTGALRLQGRQAIVAPKQQAAPIQAPKLQAKEGMPDDVRAWLEHLERIEQKRMDLARDQIVSLMVSMEEIKGAELGNQLSDLFGGDPTQEEPKEAPSVSKARDIAVNVKPQWEALNQEFESKAPPEECRQVAGEYGQTLQETGATVTDIIGIINDLGGDPQTAVAKLREIMATNKDMIDKPAIRADRGVQTICDKYGERKWFSIKGDVGGGGMFAVPSLPGLGGGL